jgi:hypothetical protein
MTTPGGLDRRVAKLAGEVAALDAGSAPLPVAVWGGAELLDDPRLRDLLIVAHREGRSIVRPVEVDGQLVDLSSDAAIRARTAHADESAVDERDLGSALTTGETA